MRLDYDWPTNHVLTRDGLPGPLRDTLMGPGRGHWRDHDNYFTGPAYGLIQAHRGLRRLAGQYRASLEALLDQQDGASPRASKLLGRKLLNNLHSHHQFEDHSVFPKISHQHPRLAQAIALLERDHQVLEPALVELGRQVEALRLQTPDRDTLGVYQPRAARLERLLERHTLDEEDVIMPVYLTYM